MEKASHKSKLKKSNILFAWQIFLFPNSRCKTCLFFSQEICNGTDNPKLFEMYFENVNDIPPYEKPNYDQLVRLFTEEQFDAD